MFNSSFDKLFFIIGIISSIIVVYILIKKIIFIEHFDVRPVNEIGNSEIGNSEIGNSEIANNEVAKKGGDSKMEQISSIKCPVGSDCIKRFYIEIFEEPNLGKRLTFLKDAPEQHNSVQVNKPIRSLRIRSIPNHHWKFTQEFSLIIYLKSDPTKKVEFKVPKWTNQSNGIDYKITDTSLDSELSWLALPLPKNVVFTVGQYYPIGDIFNINPTHFPVQGTELIEGPADTKFLWINNDEQPLN
jgi:hypothetical protein